MAESKQISYLNKDFDSFKQKLLEFAEVYYPNTYNDFSETSAGLMLIEMAAYVGDVLSFYSDNQIQENFLEFAKQRKNILSIAYNHGYFPQVTNASTTDIEIFQIIPATTSGSLTVPDFNYSLIIAEGAQIQASTDSSQLFYTRKKVDFSVSGSYDATDISVYSLDGENKPNYYLLKKKVESTSGTLKTKTFTFTAPQKFPTIEIEDSNIIEITGITDTDGNPWYEVPYLAQETIFEATANIGQNDPNLFQYNDTTPYLLRVKKVPRRYVKRFKTDNVLELQFGPGSSTLPDEVITPNTNNIGLGLPYGQDKLLTAWDPSNFTYTKTYGLAPSNTTLTVNYLVGGGAASNVGSNTLTQLASGTVTFYGDNLDPTLESTVRNSLAFNNPKAAVGGGDGDTNEEVRQKTMAQFPTQLRTVTKDDYAVRALSLPEKFGTVSKVYITKEASISANRLTAEQKYDSNLLTLYILSKDTNGKLSQADPALKQNLSTFLAEYRMLTDGVAIKDAFVINIGINFDVILQPNFNNKLVLNNCINAITEYFKTDKWQINQPIILSNVRNIIDNVEGVQTVKKLEIVNKVGNSNNYSEFAYDINGATINGVLYPSLDPSIFEIKYPETDIQGKSVVN